MFASYSDTLIVILFNPYSAAADCCIRPAKRAISALSWRHFVVAMLSVHDNTGLQNLDGSCKYSDQNLHIPMNPDSTKVVADACVATQGGVAMQDVWQDLGDVFRKIEAGQVSSVVAAVHAGDWDHTKGTVAPMGAMDVEAAEAVFRRADIHGQLNFTEFCGGGQKVLQEALTVYVPHGKVYTVMGQRVAEKSREGQQEDQES